MQESSTEWPQHTVSAFSLLAWVGHPARKTAFTVTRLFWYQTGTKTDPEHPLVPRSLHPGSLLASSVNTIQLIPRLPSRTAKERQGRNTACRYPWAGQVSCGGRAECQGTCHAETALLYPHVKLLFPGKWALNKRLGFFYFRTPEITSCIYLILSYSICLERKKKACTVGLFFVLL